MDKLNTVYKKSFSEHIKKKRDNLFNQYGQNWCRSVSTTKMKEILLSILNLDKKTLIMSNIERQRWKNKLSTENNHTQILRIFYDPQLSSEGHSLYTTKRNYR